MTVGFWNWQTTAAAALANNTATVNATVMAIMGQGIPLLNITTNYFNIQPYYGDVVSTSNDTASQVQLGYAVWNDLTVETSMVLSTNALIAAIASIPGASVQQVNWDVSDTTKMLIREQLQGMAIADSQTQAAAALAQVGNSVGSLVAIHLEEPVQVSPRWVPSSVRSSATALRMNSSMANSTMNNSTMANSTMNNSTMNNSTMNNSTMANSSMTYPTMDTSSMDVSLMDTSSMSSTGFTLPRNNATGPIYPGALWYMASAISVLNFS